MCICSLCRKQFNEEDKKVITGRMTKQVYIDGSFDIDYIDVDYNFCPKCYKDIQDKIMNDKVAVSTRGEA